MGSRRRRVASEAEGQVIASEGGAILEAKKAWMEAMAAEASSLRGRNPSLEAVKPAVAGKKKKRTKVVKTRLPDSAIEGMMAWPRDIVHNIPDDELAKHPKYFRDMYHQSKKTTEMMFAYHQALVDQYETRGYAEDESEVSDDDDDEEAAVEN